MVRARLHAHPARTHCVPSCGDLPARQRLPVCPAACATLPYKRVVIEQYVEEQTRPHRSNYSARHSATRQSLGKRGRGRGRGGRRGDK